MGRWRPPSEKGSAYITAAGFKRMKDEVTQLWKIERPQVTQVVHEAAKTVTAARTGIIFTANAACAKLIRVYVFYQNEWKP
jgi:hypothetical protein